MNHSSAFHYFTIADLPFRVVLQLLITATLWFASSVRADEVMSPDQSARARIEGKSALSANVGMMASIQQIVLPGTELIPASADDKTNLVVIRIDAVYPHADGFRYDLTWSAMESGTYDLVKFLARKDGSSTSDLPAIEVIARSILEPERIIPNVPRIPAGSSVGGYRTTMGIAAILWCAGLFAIFKLWPKKNTGHLVGADNSPRTRLEEIRNLLNAAVSGDDFSVADKVKLEGMVVGFWREHKQIQNLSAQSAVSTLREDAEAGPLLKQLERWLYDRPQLAHGDVADLLRPLQQMVESAESKASRNGASASLNSINQPPAASVESRSLGARQ